MKMTCLPTTITHLILPAVTMTQNRRRHVQNKLKVVSSTKAGSSKQRLTPTGRASTPGSSNRRSLGWAIAEAISAYAQARHNRTAFKPVAMAGQFLSHVEKAIHVLTEQYSSVLTDEEMVAAYSVMENEVKAKMFCAMPSGNPRNLWLKKQCEQQ